MKAYILATVAILGLVQCQSEAVESDTIAVEETPVAWELSKPILKRSQLELNFPGVVEFQEQGQQEISFPIAVRIEKFYKAPGTWVKTGTKIAEISHPNLIEYQRTYFQTKAEFTASQQHYKRWKNLRTNGQASESEWNTVELAHDKAKSALAASQAVLASFGIQAENLETILPSIPVYASIDGQLQSFLVSAGAYLPSERPLVRIVDAGMKRVTAELTPVLAEQISSNDTVRINSRHGAVQGYVTAVGDGSTDKNTSSVWIDIDGSFDGKSGTPVQVAVNVRGAEAWSVPLSAVLYEGNQAFIIQQRPNGNFVRTDIVLSASSSNEASFTCAEKKRVEWPVVVRMANRAYSLVSGAE